MPQIGKEYTSCRYWGYEPAIVGNIHNGSVSFDERIKMRKTYMEQRATIKDAGFRPQVLGYTIKERAINAAKRIEKKTGIEMRVFNHDYL